MSIRQYIAIPRGIRGYLPGKIKIVLLELSFGSDLTAAWMLVNSPEPGLLGRTTTAPDGGDVREARFSSTGLAEASKPSANTPAAFK
jgi:hypothetical protein